MSGLHFLPLGAVGDDNLPHCAICNKTFANTRTGRMVDVKVSATGDSTIFELRVSTALAEDALITLADGLPTGSMPSAALRALFHAHPSPALLRDAWNHSISQAWANLPLAGPMPPGMREKMQQAADVMESYIP